MNGGRAGPCGTPGHAQVDGPFRPTAFSPAGADSFAANQKYSGSPRPRISTLKYLPYTSDTTEYTGISTGQADIGQVPPQDLPVKTGSPGCRAATRWRPPATT